jgi:formamidopyrimidine-DNA glycosylase
MAERPDLEYVVPILRRELEGRTVRSVRTKKPVVWRVAVTGTPEALLSGLTFADVQRRAHFVLFRFAPPAAIELAVSPMLAGRFALADGAARAPGDLAVSVTLSDGRELRYRDDVQMGKLYLIATGAWAQVPGLATVGLDVLDETVFTREAFRVAARTRRDQIKVFLMDKTALDALGNAYADEVLWAAGVHPKRLVRSLSVEELDHVHDAIVRVLGAARTTIAARQPPLDEKLRDFLQVRGRAGQPCARCGTKIRTARVHADDAHFCPHCQPDVRRSVFVDWRKLQA